MSYPIIYETNATDFFNNGLGTLPDALTATVTEERNGEFVFDMTYPLHGIRADLIKNNRIIKANAGHKLTDQRFVIKSVAPAMDTSGNTVITVHAEHVSYLANDLAIKPQVAMTDVNAEQALNMWNDNLTTPKQFTVDSDITTHNSTSWSIDKVENSRQALGGVEGSILDVWGGEYRFDNLHISLMSKRGTVSNTLLAYGRNITSFEQEQNIMDTYTSVYPYYVVSGEANEDSTIYTVPNLVVNSDNANKFPNQKTMPLEVSSYLGDIKVGTKPADASADDKTEYITVQELQSRMTKIAQQYIKNNNIGVPKVSIKVSFVDLSKTANYADAAPLEQLDLCDEVPVRFPELDIDTTAKVSRVIWNVLTDSYDSLELGDISATLGDKISQVEQNINKTNNKIDEIHNIVQTGADGKSTVFRGPDTPTANHVGDLWYKPNGEDTDIYQWDGVTWVLVVSTKDTHEIRDKVDKAIQEMEDKEKEINANSELQKIDISQAQADIEQARQDAANSIADIRDSVVKDMADAKAQSKQALDKANTVDAKATEALTNAEQAVNDAKEAQSTTATIKTDVDTVKGQLSSKADKTTVDDLTKTVSNNSTSITQNAKDIKTKANSSTVDTLASKVTDAETSISQNATDIKSKADKSIVDTLNQTVKNQGTAITQNATDIKSKASSSDVNKLSGRVSTAETTLTQTADGLKGKADKTALDKVSGDLTTLSNNFETTSEGFSADISKIHSDVDTNANSISTAKADIKVTADNLSANYTKTLDMNTYVNSQVKQSADAINASVTSLSNVVNTENTNLIYNGSFKNGDYWVFKDGSTVSYLSNIRYMPISAGTFVSMLNSAADYGLRQHLSAKNVTVVQDRTIIFSGYARTADASTDGKFRPYITSFAPDGTATNYGTTTSYPIDTSWRRYSVMAKIPKDAKSVDVIFNQIGLADKKVYITGAQLTVGGNLLPYVDSNFENDDKIAQLQITADSIKTTVANKADISYVNQKADSITSTVGQNKADTDKAISQIQQKADSITQTVADNKADADGKFSTIQQNVDGIKSTVYTKTETDSKLDGKATVTQVSQLSDQINLTVAQTSAEKTNLILNGSFRNADNWNFGSLSPSFRVAAGAPIASGNYAAFKSKSADSNIVYQQVSASVVSSIKGNKITLSFYARSATAAGTFRAYIKATPASGDASYTYGSPINLLTGWQRVSLTTTVPANTAAVNLTFEYKGVAVDTNCYITGALLTLGDQLVPFSESTRDIVSQINLDDTGVLIRGKKIMIDGDATIKNAVIKSSMIDTLDASKITTGVLNAANVNIINLNASNIVTGALDSTKIKLVGKDSTIDMSGDGVEIISNDSTPRSVVIDDGSINFSRASNGKHEYLGAVESFYSYYNTSTNGIGVFLKTNKYLGDPYGGDEFRLGYYNALTGDNKITSDMVYDASGQSHQGGFNFYNKAVIVHDGMDVYGETRLYDRVVLGRSGDNPPIINMGGEARMYGTGGVILGTYDYSTETPGTKMRIDRNNVNVWDNFNVYNGSKNAAQVTRDGVRLTPAYETAENYVGDIGESSTGDNRKVKVIIEDVLTDLMNTGIAYQVFLSPYSNANAWVSERGTDYFVIESDRPNVPFAWELKGKRRGFESERLVRTDDTFTDVKMMEEKKGLKEA